MGTETKFNNYTENPSSATDPISKAIVGFSVGKFNSNCVKVGSDSSDISKPEVIPYVSIHIDEENVIEGAKEILRSIRPHWDLKDVEFKVIFINVFLIFPKQ